MQTLPMQLSSSQLNAFEPSTHDTESKDFSPLPQFDFRSNCNFLFFRRLALDQLKLALSPHHQTAFRIFAIGQYLRKVIAFSESLVNENASSTGDIYNRFLHFENRV
jgi:hypothetical protein